MENKKMEFVYVKSLFHLGGRSHEIVYRFKEFIEKEIIDISKIIAVVINYVPTLSDTKKDAVSIFFEDGVAIYLNLTACYPGTGSLTCYEVLKLCNIGFDEKNIFSNQDAVDFKFTKNKDDIIYQIETFNGEYIYTI